MFKLTRFVNFNALSNNLNACVSTNRWFVLSNLRRTFPNLKTNVSAKNFHCCSSIFAKIFSDRENAYAYSIIQNIEVYKSIPDFNKAIIKSEINTAEEFNAFLDQDFRKKSATEVVAAFKNVIQFCKTNEINLSDKRFDKLTDGLMDNAEKLTDEQLFELLDTLSEFPQCESFKSHNFHDIWSALDDVCCWRMLNWNRKTQYFVAAKWYNLHLGKLCDYIFELLYKTSNKAKNLTKDELVHAFFYMNVCRKMKMCFEYEAALEKKIGEMSLDEIAVVAMGYFKSKSKVKIPQICLTMIRKIMEVENPHEMSLCAILKLLRFTSRPEFGDDIYKLLEHLKPKLDNYSTLLLLHAGLVGTTIQMLHEPTLKAVAERIASEIEIVERVRLKDIERILLPLAMFDYDPKTTPDIYKAALKELHSERRLVETVRHPRCIPCALMFLSIHGIYSYELMNKVLDKNFITDTFGNSSKHLPRDLLSLDVCIEIECPDYKGNRLEPKTRHKAAKWLTSYPPTKDQKKRISKSDSLYLKTVDAVSEICGGEEYYKIDHVLAQFDRADIIICKDTKTNKFVKPNGLENYELGDVMRPPKGDHLKWYSIIVVGWNSTIRNSTALVGSIKYKMRLLSKIGYKPIPILWNELPENIEDQKQYIVSKL